jgi:hypothetical protein
MHAEVHETLYVEPPAGYYDHDVVWHLRKALNGIRRAPKDFQQFVTETFVEMEMVQLKSDPMIFKHKARPLYVSMHVDDPIGFGRQPDLDWFFEEASKRMLIKKEPPVQVGETFSYLGRRFMRTATGFRRQASESYIRDTLEIAGMRVIKPALVPGPPAATLKQQEEPLKDEEKQRIFPTLVGRLMFLAGDRPDIQYATKELARRTKDITDTSWIMMKHLLRYLASTQDFTYEINPTELEPKLTANVDSNWGNCTTTRKSTSSVHIFFAGVLIRSLSRTQATIALSSGEAEFYAIALGGAESIFLKNILSELLPELTFNIEIFSDSVAGRAMALRLGPGRVKHLDLKTLWIQEAARLHKINILKIHTDDNTSDLGTKYLPKEVHRRHCLACNLYSSAFYD